MPIEDDATIARFNVRRRGSETSELHAHVARLVWAVLHDTKPAVRPAAKVLRVGAEEFDDQLADVLVVRTGVTGTELALELHGADGQAGRRSASVIAAGREGRWSFDLGPFADLIRRSDEGRLTFRMLVNGWPVHVADIVARIEVSRWRATTRIADDFAEVVLSFDQERDVRGRIARLWPQHRPWERPIETPIADGAREARFAGYGLLSPGPTSRRSRSRILGSRRGARATEGRPRGRSSRGRANRSTSISNPWIRETRRSHVIWALTGHDTPDELEAAALAGIAKDLATAAAFSLLDTPPTMPSPAAFHRVARLLTRSDRLLCRALLSAARGGRDRAAEMNRLSLRLMPRLEPTADELDDADATGAMADKSAHCRQSGRSVGSAGRERGGQRCETFLGWTPGSSSPQVGGAQVNQAFLAMPADVLREIRRSLGAASEPAP